MTFKIVITIIATIILAATFKGMISAFSKPQVAPETPIDKAWWDGLSEEWKTILLINQNFSKQHVDFFKLQNHYINRLNVGNEDGYTELNTSLRDLYEKEKFSLSYSDLYSRALKHESLIAGDSIDLSTLKDLDRIYMVSGPGDLTPLKKFPNLKVLIINYCGIDNSKPLSGQALDLEPLRNLKLLEYLHCSSPTLRSLEPIKDLTNLLELHFDNSDITSLSPLKNLQKLESLSFGSKVKAAEVVARLSNLRELYIDGCKKIPDLSKLKKLQKLCIVENEFALVNESYRILNINFLKDLLSLEYLDLELTSYRGTLEGLKPLQQLKAVTLPRVKISVMNEFQNDHQDCVIINSFEFE
jgi:Leucine-rich repeat (LRR) protein